jgi:hypothetical protein
LSPLLATEPRFPKMTSHDIFSGMFVPTHGAHIVFVVVFVPFASARHRHGGCGDASVCTIPVQVSRRGSLPCSPLKCPRAFAIPAPHPVVADALRQLRVLLLRVVQQRCVVLLQDLQRRFPLFLVHHRLRPLSGSARRIRKRTELQHVLRPLLVLGVPVPQLVLQDPHVLEDHRRPGRWWKRPLVLVFYNDHRLPMECSRQRLRLRFHQPRCKAKPQDPHRGLHGRQVVLEPKVSRPLARPV